MRKTAAMTAILISTVLAVTGCTPSERPSDLPDGGANVSQQAAPAPSSAAAPTSTSPSGPPCTVDKVVVSGAAGQKPTVAIPSDCAPPTELLSKDLIPGTGPAIKLGDQLQMHYALYTWSTKAENQASFGSSPLQTPLAQGALIDGWVEGLPGMKQGGRRLLVVPPAKGYKAAGKGNIKGNETLVFVVDAIKVGA